MFLSNMVSSRRLGRFWWNLVHRFPNKFAAKWCEHFSPHLNNDSTLPCELEMLIGHVLPLSCYKKKLQNLSNLNCGPNLPDLNPVDYSVWGLLQEKVYKIRITDLNKLKQRLRTEWASWAMSSLHKTIVSGIADSSKAVCMFCTPYLAIFPTCCMCAMSISSFTR